MSPEEPIPVHERTIALVGLMGVGKSTVGRRLANRLVLPFVDGDEAIEAAARMMRGSTGRRASRISQSFQKEGCPSFAICTASWPSSRFRRSSGGPKATVGSTNQMSASDAESKRWGVSGSTRMQ